MVGTTEDGENIGDNEEEVMVDKKENIDANGLVNVDHDADRELTLEDLAPDGGWGWIVAFAMTIVFVSIK